MEKKEEADQESSVSGKQKEWQEEKISTMSNVAGSLWSLEAEIIVPNLVIKKTAIFS